MDDINLDLDSAILTEILHSPVPLGAVYLALTLGEKYNVSQATIGRKLLYMDHKGYTQKVKNKGRVLTDKGIEYLSDLKNILLFEKAKDEFLKSIELSSLQNLIDVLVTRRGLEREAAFLAAKNAKDEDIKKMQKVLADQKAKLDRGIPGDEEDREFHRLIAQASQNKILLKTIMLMREQNNLTKHFASIRKITGGKLYMDHVTILEKIQGKDPKGAAQSIETHINKMIKEIESFSIK